MPTTVTPETVGFSSEGLNRIGGWMAGYVDAGKLPFAMTLIARAGEVAYFDMVGQADVEAGTAIAEGEPPDPPLMDRLDHRGIFVGLRRVNGGTEGDHLWQALAGFDRQ